MELSRTIAATFLGLALALALLCLLGRGPDVARADDLTVCPQGPPTCGYATVQAAVDAAHDGDTIKVATGVYTGVSARAGIAQAVYITKSVTIRGGYTTAFADPPDPDANPTTLDAQGQGRVMYITGNISPTIEGLRITGGNAIGLGGLPWGTDVGGGIYAITATVILKNNRVFSNTANAGGGVNLWHSDTMLNGNIITGNNDGGLLLAYSVGTFIDNTFTANTAGYGGGLFLAFSTVTLSGNTVTANTASHWGGGLYVEGGDAMLSGNIITANTAEWGGGLLLDDCDGATLNSNAIISNVADHGGGMFLGYSDATLTNDVIADNRANVAGGGLYILRSSPHLLHTTIARNTGGDGSGVYVIGDEWGAYDSTVALTNTILVSHTVGITVTAGSTVTLEATLWGSGAWANGADWGGAGTIATGTVNVWGDPAFANPDAGDYHIGPGSAALDRGVSAGVHTDMDNEPRPWQVPDIGADEYWAPGALKRAYLPLVLRDD